jgi:hypothetical protein
MEYRISAWFTPLNSSFDFLTDSVIMACTNDVVLMLIKACFTRISYATPLPYRFSVMICTNVASLVIWSRIFRM